MDNQTLRTKLNELVAADPAVAVLNFGADKTANNQTFSVPMPANLVDTALIRIK